MKQITQWLQRTALLVLMIPAVAAAMTPEESPIFLHVQVDAMLHHPIVQRIQKQARMDMTDKQKAMDNVLGESFREELKSLTLFGIAQEQRKPDLTLVLQGPFDPTVRSAIFQALSDKGASVEKRQNQRIATINVKKYETDEGQVKASDSRTSSENKDDDSNAQVKVNVQVTPNSVKEFYVFELPSGDMVAVTRADQIDAWLSGRISMAKTKKPPLLEGHVSTDKALAAMGVDVEALKKGADFQSETISQIRTLVATLENAGDDLLIKLDARATDEDTATQLRNVIQGLIGLQALAANSEKGRNDPNVALLGQLLQQVQINQLKENLSVSVPLKASWVDQLLAQRGEEAPSNESENADEDESDKS